MLLDPSGPSQMVAIIFMHMMSVVARNLFSGQRVFDFRTDVRTPCVKIMTNLFGRGLGWSKIMLRAITENSAGLQSSRSALLSLYNNFHLDDFEKLMIYV